jgi:hypothetical protein
VAARSKAWVCSSLVGTASSNPAGGGDMHIYFCVCSLLSGRGLCDGPIPRPEEFYRACVCMCQSLFYTGYDANKNTPSIQVFVHIFIHLTILNLVSETSTI